MPSNTNRKRAAERLAAELGISYQAALVRIRAGEKPSTEPMIVDDLGVAAGTPSSGVAARLLLEVRAAEAYDTLLREAAEELFTLTHGSTYEQEELDDAIAALDPLDVLDGQWRLANRIAVDAASSVGLTDPDVLETFLGERWLGDRPEYASSLAAYAVASPVGDRKGQLDRSVLVEIPAEEVLTGDALILVGGEPFWPDEDPRVLVELARSGSLNTIVERLDGPARDGSLTLRLTTTTADLRVGDLISVYRDEVVGELASILNRMKATMPFDAREVLDGRRPGGLGADVTKPGYSRRDPYVGVGIDGYLRSERIDLEEIDGLAADNPRVDDLRASAARWRGLAIDAQEEVERFESDPRVLDIFARLAPGVDAETNDALREELRAVAAELDVQLDAPDVVTAIASIAAGAAAARAESRGLTEEEQYALEMHWRGAVVDADGNDIEGSHQLIFLQLESDAELTEEAARLDFRRTFRADPEELYLYHLPLDDLFSKYWIDLSGDIGEVMETSAYSLTAVIIQDVPIVERPRTFKRGR